MTTARACEAPAIHAIWYAVSDFALRPQTT